MDYINTYKHLLLASTAALLAAAIGLVWLIGGSKSNPPRADAGATSEKAAAAAGAQLTPTQPKLRVEPK